MWDWAKAAQLNQNELMNKLLLTKDKCGYTVLHRAAESGNLEALETLWCWANETKLKPNELLLAQNKEGNTAWQVAAQ